VDPIAVEIDETARFPEEVFAELAKGDWMGIPIPTAYGGAGSSYLTHIIAVEELSRSCAATGFTLSIHVGIAEMLLLLFGTEEQKKNYLSPLARGEQLGAFVLTEPGAGTDVMAAQTEITRDGDYYVINGTKTFTSNGPNAGVYLVFGWTDRAAGRKGMSALIVPRGTPGMKVGEHFQKMGIRASQTSEMIFEQCRVPRENLLGKEGEGLAIAMTGFDNGRIGIAAQSVGILQAALDESIRYAKERVQFGTPIARHQAISWMIADMGTDLAAARFLTYHAAWLKDQGAPSRGRPRWQNSSLPRQR